MKKVKININQKKCGDPRDCRICVGLCPPGVFNLFYTDKDYHNPQNWIISPVFNHLCTKCNECVEKCPQQAISILN